MSGEEFRACNVSIIVPTYREAENLAVIIPCIAQVLRSANLSGEIVVVDDNSPDGTPAVCEKLSRDFPVRLLVRKNERGLSTAVVHGMRQSQGGVLLVMDADLSHPPEKIPELYNAIESGEADFVIGSRYVEGGSTEEGWGLFRWLNSKIATLMAFPLTSAKDPMAGFIALARDTFARARKLDPVGYKIGLELIVKCDCRRIREIPITFQNRLHGESKLSLREQFNYLRHLKRLYEYKLGIFTQALQFAVIGATGMVVDLSAFTVLLHVMSPFFARAFAIWVAMSWNFWLHRRVTFSDFRSRSALRQYLIFCLSCLTGALVNWLTFYWLHASVPFFVSVPQVAALLGILAGSIFNYVMSKYVAFT